MFTTPLTTVVYPCCEVHPLIITKVPIKKYLFTHFELDVHIIFDNAIVIGVAIDTAGIT